MSNLPVVPTDIDDTRNLPYVPDYPLPAKSFAMYFVGCPKSGKTNLVFSLLLGNSLKKQKNVSRNRYYNKFFDKVHLISGSLSTLPDVVRKSLPENQQHSGYNDELMMQIVNDMKAGPNGNNLIILDDVVKNMTKRSGSVLFPVFANRRHITHDGDPKKNKIKGGLSLITTSQKYTMLDSMYRNAQSHVFIFRCSNKLELEKIKDELMSDLTKDQQNEVLDIAWQDDHGFLMIAMQEPKHNKYFKNFSPILID